MAQAQLVGCPNCGAELWLPPGYAGFRCQYCAVHVGLRGAEPRRAKQQPISVGKQPATRPGNYVPPLVQVSRKKRAVLCGISYKNKPYELKGTINDVNCMKYLLTTRFKFPEESVIVLTEKEKDYRRIPTKRNMQIWMRWLVQDCQPGDSLVFHYAGHGSQQEDHTGHEVDGYDETLLPLDFETEGMIVDNEINDTLVKPLPLGVRLHAIIDACHSGTVLDLPYVCLFNPSEGKCVWEDHTPQNGTRKGTRGGEAISFSGCDDDQTSAEAKALSKITSTGAMTFSFIKAIEKGDGKTYGSLLTSMRDGIREARQKPNKRSTLTSMIFEGDNYKQGKIQEPQLSSSYPFNINEKPFYL